MSGLRPAVLPIGVACVAVISAMAGMVAHDGVHHLGIHHSITWPRLPLHKLRCGLRRGFACGSARHAVYRAQTV